MNKQFRSIALISIILVLAAWGIAQSTSVQTAKDPVCGMNVKIEGAKYSAEYQGQKYYFCSEGCKTEFLKNPVKYTGEKAAEAESAEGCGAGCAKSCAPSAEKVGEASMAATQAEAMKGCPKMASGCDGGCCMQMMRMMHEMHGMPGRMGMMGRGMPGHGAWMMNQGDILVENTADGVVVRITSKDPEVVKMIQERWVVRMKARDPKTCPMHKPAEVKKEK
jgi:YHS domain-containing protein